MQMTYTGHDGAVAAADNLSGLGLAPETSRTPVSLRYVRTAPLRVVGESSRQQYEFSGAAPIQAVDPRDLFQLLNMGYFSRA